jgi:hypothetical protein
MSDSKALSCVSALDKGRLEALIERVFAGRQLSPPALTVLQRLRTADLVVAPEDVPRDLVTMNSTVRLADPMSSENLELTLVYPEDHDPGRQLLVRPESDRRRACSATGFTSRRVFACRRANACAGSWPTSRSSRRPTTG